LGGSGTKKDFLVNVFEYLRHLLEDVPFEELTPNHLFLKVPQIYKCCPKQESKKGYEDPGSTRLFFLSPLLAYCIEKTDFYPLGSLIKKNLPCFQGFDWNSGAANDIFELFTISRNEWVKAVLRDPELADAYTLEELLKVDFYNHDIKRQDQTYSSNMIWLLLTFSYSLFYVPKHEETGSYFYDKDLEKFLNDFDGGAENNVFSENLREETSRDTHGNRWEKLRDFIFHSHSMPLVYHPVTEEFILMLRLLCSGIPITGAGNTIVNASTVPVVIKMMMDKARHRNEKKDVKILKLFLDVLIKFPNCVNMGDNFLGPFPKIFRKYMFDDDFVKGVTPNPYAHSLIELALNKLGMQSKIEESYVTFNFKLLPVHEPGPPIDGYGTVPSFCQRYMMYLKFPKEVINLGELSSRAFNVPDLKINAIVVPVRYRTDFFSKISPYAHNGTMITYFLKLNSLIRENGAIFPEIHIMLTRLRNSVRVLLKEAGFCISEYLEYLFNSSLNDKVELLKKLGYYDFSVDDIEHIIPRLGKLPTMKELHLGFCNRDRDTWRINLKRELNHESLYPDARTKPIPVTVSVFMKMQELTLKDGRVFDPSIYDPILGF
jgi:hypothetical protein